MPLGEHPQVINRGPMNAPALDRQRDPMHCFHRRSRHAFAEQLPLEVPEGAHLEVIAEKSETRRDVPPAERADVGDLRFVLVDRQPDLLHPGCQPLANLHRVTHR